MKRQYVEQEKTVVSRLQNEHNQRTSVYEQNMGNLSKEREDLHRKNLENEHQIKTLMN